MQKFTNHHVPAISVNKTANYMGDQNRSLKPECEKPTRLFSHASHIFKSYIQLLYEAAVQLEKQDVVLITFIIHYCLAGRGSTETTG